MIALLCFTNALGALTLTLTSYLDHDLDQDYDHDQLMHGIDASGPRGYEVRLAKSVAHGESKTTDPGSGANTLAVTAHSAGGLSKEGPPVHASTASAQPTTSMAVS